MRAKGGLLEATIVAMAVAARVAAVLVLDNHDVPNSTYEHGEIAANLLAGRGFSMEFLGADGPTSQQAPVYPALVAAAYAIGGVGTPQSLLLIELGQSGLGGLLAWGVIRLARRIVPGSRWRAAAAGLIAAAHPTLIYAATHVQVAGLGATLLVWTLVWAHRAAESGKARHAAITGGFLAVLAQTDPILSLGMIGIFGVYRTRCRGISGWVKSVRLAAITMAAAAAGVSPWTVRNYLVHGELVAIKSTFGYAFWQGNCAMSEGTDKVRRESVGPILRRGDGASSLGELNRTLWEARHEAGYLDDVALTRAEKEALGTLAEPERARVLFRRALDDLSADPWRYPLLCLSRLKAFVLFDETNPKSSVMAYRLPHVGLTLLAAAGLILAGPDVRRQLWPTIATAGAIAIFHSLTIVSARFHIPIEPLMATWAATGISGEAPRGGFSAPAPHHVKRVGVKRRLGVGRRG